MSAPAARLFRDTPALSAADEAALELERHATNLSRIRSAAWLAMVAHALHVVVFWLTRGDAESALTARWRLGIIAAHLVVFGFDAVVLGLTRRATQGLRWLPAVFAFVYLCLGATLAGLDQAVTSDTSPWLMVVVAMVLLVRLDDALMLGALGVSFTGFLAGQWQFQPDVAVRLSNSVKGLSVMVLGLVLALVFGRSQRREFQQRRLIARQHDELEHALDEARRAALAADAANRAKSTFLATISHEIRTPMTGVLGVTDLLAGTVLDDNQRRLLQTVQESGQSLVMLINDLLDLSKAEAGRLHVEAVPMDVAREVEQVVRLFEPKAQLKGLTLASSWTARPPVVKGDPLRVRQVLSNLVANALKFTAKGGVEVRCRAQVQGATCALVLEVVDTGPGLTAQTLGRLFQPYMQADASTARAYGGTGLGLVISRQLAEAMGGRLEAQSVEGAGSTFRLALDLPCAAEGEAPADARAQVAASTVAGTLDGRVLVADDNPVNQLVLREMLRQLGLEVEVAGDGMGALMLLEEHHFDAVLTDLHMPGVDGLELLRQLREGDVGAPRVPVLVLTAGVGAEERAACLAAGATAVLSKPVRLSELQEGLKFLARAELAALPPG